MWGSPKEVEYEMKNYKALLVALIAGMFTYVGCSVESTSSDDDDGAGGAGGSAAQTGTGTVSSTGAGVTTGPSTTAVTSTDSSTATGMMMTSICGSTLTYNNAAIDQCITDNCCAEFNPCAQDQACTDCLTNPDAMGCDENTLYQAYQTCRTTNCSTTMCGTTIGFSSNMGQNPNFECNGCAGTKCCDSLTACAGMDNMDQTQIDLCIACLNNPMDAKCNDAATKKAAEDFNTCVDMQCKSECG